MSALRTLREWVRDQIIGLTPGTFPGVAFLESQGTEPLINMPKDDRFHRSFRVVSQKNQTARLRWVGQAEFEGTITVQLGYFGYQDDIQLQNLMDDDDEQITLAITTATDLDGAPVCDLSRSGATVLELSAEGSNIVILEITYTVIYNAP